MTAGLWTHAMGGNLHGATGEVHDTENGYLYKGSDRLGDVANNQDKRDALLNKGYAYIVQADFQSERSYLTGCDYYWLMKSNPECNLYLSQADMRAHHPDDLTFVQDADRVWRTQDNQNQDLTWPVQTTLMEEGKESEAPFRYNFAYETPGYICGFRVTELQRAFPNLDHRIGENNWSAEDEQKFRDRTCYKEWFAFINPQMDDETKQIKSYDASPEPDWTVQKMILNPETQLVDKPFSRGICEFDPLTDEIVQDSVNCHGGEDAQRCCYLTYWDRYTMNRHRRHSIYTNLFQERAHYRYNKVFSKKRTQTLADQVRMLVFEQCQTEGQCSYPPNYNFNAHPNSQGNTDAMHAVAVNYETDELFEYQPNAVEPEQGSTVNITKNVAECVCPSGGRYQVAGEMSADWETCHTRAETCVGGVSTCKSEWIGNSTDILETPKMVQCGKPVNPHMPVLIDIMREFNDMDDEHYYDFDVSTTFQQVEKYWGELEKKRPTVLGKRCMSFKYNPVGACRQENENGVSISSDVHCTPWTKNINSCWSFEVFHKYAETQVVADAANFHDLRIRFIPEFCDLTYKPIQISRVMLKCELQKKLMKSITTQIWHEKLRYDLKEVINNNVVPYFYVEDPNFNGHAWKDSATVVDGVEVLWSQNRGFKLASFPQNPTEADYAGLCDPKNPPSNLYTDEDGHLSYESEEDSRCNCQDPDAAQYCTMWKPGKVAGPTGIDYSLNLDEINKSVSRIYSEYQKSDQRKYIPHCLKKHLTFNKMDFYCLTDTDEIMNPGQFDANGIKQIFNDVRQEFETNDLGAYQAHATDSGFVIQNVNTYKNAGDGHIYNSVKDDQFDAMEERRKAVSQEFTAAEGVAGPAE
jgi:hypothetical protein